MLNFNRSVVTWFLCGAALFVLLAAAVFAAAQTPVRLLPAPREAHFGETTELPAKILVTVPGHDAEDEFAARDLESAIKLIAPDADAPRADAAKPPYRITLQRTSSADAKALLARNRLAFDPVMESEGYILILSSHDAAIVAATGSGLFYGVQTFKQLLPLPGASRVLATGTVRDWPAMRYRGIHDDLSRGPFPTLEFQKHQIRVFAAFKINIYSPYFEHTLLYPDHPLAAPPGGAFTPADAAELVAYARQYHVTIIPEQEAFGHLHHVLKWELYQDVAETLHGYVLAPGQPGTLPLIKDWFTEIAQEFPSPFIHIGGDEAFDLGAGRTREAVEQQGYGPVYVDFLKQIHLALAPLNRRLLFWGDIGDANPGAVPGLPKDMIAVPWNYGDHRPRQDDHAFRQGRHRDLGRARRCQLERGLSRRQDRALEHSGLYSRRPAPGFNRRAHHRLERRRRGPLQYGLVRRPLWRGGRVAAWRKPHRRLPGGLWAGLPPRPQRQDQRGRKGIDGRSGSHCQRQNRI